MTRHAVTAPMGVIGIAIAWSLVLPANAQQATATPTADARISAALKDISSAHIQANIEKLVSFGSETSALYDTGVKPLLIFRLDRFLRGGDHYSFNQQGFAAVRFTEYREDFTRQHQNVRREGDIEYGDLPKFVDVDYVARVARLNAATLASLASAPAAPAHVKVLTGTLDNDSTLKWEPSAGASSYEVVWRATSSPEWENARNIGSITTATLAVSKDNVLFAVRAVDNEGHRSLPAVPSQDP